MSACVSRAVTATSPIGAANWFTAVKTENARPRSFSGMSSVTRTIDNGPRNPPPTPATNMPAMTSQGTPRAPSIEKPMRSRAMAVVHIAENVTMKHASAPADAPPEKPARKAFFRGVNMATLARVPMNAAGIARMKPVNAGAMRPTPMDMTPQAMAAA